MPIRLDMLVGSAVQDEPSLSLRCIQFHGEGASEGTKEQNDKSRNAECHCRDLKKMLVKLRAEPGVTERSRNFLSSLP